MKKGNGQGRESEKELEGLTEAQYERWANGSRGQIVNRKVDPQTADAIRRAFPKETK